MTWEGEVIGHRGAPVAEPENTLASFEAAIAAGADGVELDVRVTSDGHAVVFHDATLERLVPDAGPVDVAACTLERLRASVVGGRAGRFVPSLDEVLDALRGRTRVHVEIKSEAGSGLHALRLAIDAIAKHGVSSGTSLSSFDEHVVREAGSLAPGIERALIIGRRHLARGAGADAIALTLGAGAGALHVHQAITDGALVARGRDAGLRLRCWTANDEETIVRLMALGVDGILSDDPGLVRRLAG